MIEGSAKGDRPLSVGPMGELTEVASAKRAVRGVLRDSEDDELDDVLGLVVTLGAFLSSAGVNRNSGIVCLGAFDISLR